MNISIQLVDYATHRAILHQIRHAVFVEEQGVPAAIEVDRWDRLSTHALAHHQGQPVGTGRLLPDGHIGRIAVLPSLRHQGLGSQIMALLLQAASQQGHAQVVISAQCHAIAFYQRLGFRAEGSVYQEAGIDHIQMVKPIGPGKTDWPLKLSPADALAIGAARP
ncbi:GNAT family N-acetyltransferase [filamentous cyanobacterium CCP5]|nr:GNAT family N-acetyltransferase [filamentous cyanobacterium CCP5]